jgi:hypothetical protein
MIILGLVGILMIAWGLYTLCWEAWKAKRAISRISICLAGIVTIAIGYLFANIGFSG